MAALLGTALGAGDAHAYVVKKTTAGQLVHWETRDVHYSVDPSVEANVAQGFAATALAMQSWSGSVGAPDLHADVADATSPTKPGFDSKNGVFFMAGGYAPAGRALAITVLTYDNASGKILDADVIFNGSYKLVVLGNEGSPASAGVASTTDAVLHDPAQTTASDATLYDLHHIVAHELGHSLGMNDELDRHDALMYRYTAPNDATLRQPGSDDITGLAELYSTQLDAHGNGCGGATVAPKKPSLAAQHAALLATLGLLAFLVLRAKSDRRARIGFVLAAAAAAVVLLPSVSKTDGGLARASETAPGHARAKVFSATTSIEDGLLKTTYKLATTVCRATTCPKLGHGAAWGGQIGNIRQEVGGQFAPQGGDEVDVSFTQLPNALAPLSSPLGARDATSDEAEVRVLTSAQ